MIREVQASDFEAISEIYNEYILRSTATFEVEPVTALTLKERWIEMPLQCPYLVWTDDDGRVQGYAYAHLWQERAAYARTWETTVYVRRGCAGRGIGSALMRRLIDGCRRAGVPPGGVPRARGVHHGGERRQPADARAAGLPSGVAVQGGGMEVRPLAGRDGL